MRNSKTIDDMAELVGGAKGKLYFDKFRSQIKLFKERESSLMMVRSDELTSTDNMLVTYTLFGTLVAILLGLFVAFRLTRHVMGLLGGEPSDIA